MISFIRLQSPPPSIAILAVAVAAVVAKMTSQTTDQGWQQHGEDDKTLLERIRRPLNSLQKNIFDHVLDNLNKIALIQAGPGKR